MPGTWKPIHNTPDFAASTMLLLTDGTVMCQAYGDRSWWKLTPDQKGDYTSKDATWSPLAPMHHTRLFFASAVLADGRVIVAGGEYSDAGGETHTAEIYDPQLDQWKDLSGLPTTWSEIGDAPCCVLADGRFLLGSIGTTATAIFDPKTDTWSAGGSKNDVSSEETWTLLPDGTVLTAECSNSGASEKYLPSTNQWIDAGATGVDLISTHSIEIGPAFLMPQGNVFALGGTGHTAFYQPPANPTDKGTWTTGPDIPPDTGGNSLGGDNPGCLLPNGKVLCACGPNQGFSPPASFFEFDGTNWHAAPAPATYNDKTFAMRMLLLPTGQVLFAARTHDLYCYTPDGAPKDAWRPVITDAPDELMAFAVNSLKGRQLNGLSQAVAFGDDASAATNYPIVRLKHLQSGEIHYCRTFGHSTMGVATGSQVVSTTFSIPWNAPAGDSELTVVANGIPSLPKKVKVHPFVRPQYLAWAWARLIGSLADGPLWVLGPHGPVPVDPWGPAFAAQAREAWAKVRVGLHELEHLGTKLAAARANVDKEKPVSDETILAERSKERARRR
jgi:hypothetical protein